MFRWTGFDSAPIKYLKRAATVFALAAVFLCCVGRPASADKAMWQPLIDRLVADGFEREYLETLYAREEVEFSPEIMGRKMNVLLNTKLADAAPGPKRTPQVMGRYLNPMLIAGAYAFYREHSAPLHRIEAEYGVPGEVLTALMLVETKLGTQTGKHRALTILSSMALGGDFELIRDEINRTDLSEETMTWLVNRTGQKGEWGYAELTALLRYALQSGQDPATIPSSMYGAIGQCQFIPTSAMHYGVDGSGDGVVDLFDTTDALYSIGNFLARHGWKPGLDQESRIKVVYRYNHSYSYAMTILEVADRLRQTKEFFGN